MSEARIIRAQLVDFPGGSAISHQEKGALVIGADGRIVWRGDFSEVPGRFKMLPVEDHGDLLLMPGFVDAHIHFPQYRMLAAPGKDLLDWLNRFTFPEEARYADHAHAEVAAEIFLDRLAAHGTTSVLAFCSVHETCAEALFTAADRRGMALVTGKTMMDRNAPDAVRDTAEEGALASERLITRFHGKGRLRYAVTPRFAITSTAEQLAASGELLARHKTVLMQTHLSESHPEMAAVKGLFPKHRDYTDVYDSFGLLTDRSFFAHGIHLSERESARLAESGSTLVHCPTSNTFLGSGLFDIARQQDARRPVGVGLATDVGGGTSYSMLATMGEAYKVAMLTGTKLTAAELFHLATAGNAGRLGLGGEIGRLGPGLYADLVLIDPRATPVLAARQDLSTSLEDVLFSLAILGDDRAIAASWIAGRSVYQRKSAP